VVTLNVFGPANPDWQRRRQVIARVLHDVAPDVIALQEVPVDDGFETVRALLGDGYAVHAFSQPATDGVAGVLASRSASRLVAEIDQRCTPRARSLPWCATVLVETTTDVGTTLVAHHKPSWQFGCELEREQQAVAAVERIEALAPDYDHVVVLGDFDAPPDAASMQFWRGRRSLSGISVCYQDAWATLHPYDPGLTFLAENPLVRAGEVNTALERRIDYVLVRAGAHGPSLAVASCERLFAEPVDGVWASDHCGVVADLVVPAVAPGSMGVPELEPDARDGQAGSGTSSTAPTA